MAGTRRLSDILGKLINPAKKELQEQQINLQRLSDWGFKNIVGENATIVGFQKLGGHNPSADPLIDFNKPEMASRISQPLIDLKADTSFYISSSNNSDDQLLVVDGFKNDLTPIATFKNLNGFTQELLPDDMRFVRGISNATPNNFLGEVFVSQDAGVDITNGKPDDETLIHAIASSRENFAINPIGVVPSGQSAYVSDYNGYVSASKDADPLIGFKLPGLNDFRYTPVFEVNAAEFVNNRFFGFTLPEGTIFYLAVDTDNINTRISSGITALFYV